MREILFRAKRVDNGKWVRGNLIDNECCKKPIIVEVDYLNEYGDFGEVSHEVDEKTVGQYIGLTDKNGKKIFEGDIIQFGEDEEYDWEFNIGVVKFGEGTFDSGIYVYTGFFYEDKNGNIDHNALYNWEEDWERCKVIGNVYDNPELLNKE